MNRLQAQGSGTLNNENVPLYLSKDGLLYLNSRLEYNKSIRNVTEINFSSKKVKVLDSKVFKHMKQLEKIDFSLNQIEALDDNIFVGLENLKEIDFSNNNITYLHENIFDGLNNLKSIVFRGNKISFISPFMFKRASNGTLIDFSWYYERNDRFMYWDSEKLLREFYALDGLLIKTRKSHFGRYITMWLLSKKAIIVKTISNEDFDLIRQLDEENLKDLNDVSYYNEACFTPLDFLVRIETFTNEQLTNLIDRAKTSTHDIKECDEFRIKSKETISYICKRDSEKLARLSLELIDIDLEDHPSFLKCFEIALSSRNEGIAIFLIRYFWSLFPKQSYNLASYSDFFEKYDFKINNKKLLKRCFDLKWWRFFNELLDLYHISNNQDLKQLFFFMFEYNLGGSAYNQGAKSSCCEALFERCRTRRFVLVKTASHNHLLHFIEASGQSALIQHATTRIFVDVKWKGLPQTTYWGNLILYILFVILYTIYAENLNKFMRLNSECYENSTTTAACVKTNKILDSFQIIKFISLALAIFFFCGEIFQIIFFRSSYFMIPQNIFEFFNFPLCIYLILNFKFNPLMSLTIIFTYLILILRLEKFTYDFHIFKINLGIYITVLKRVSTKAIQVLPLVFIAWFGFLFSFRTTSRYVSYLRDLNRTDFEPNMFNETISLSFIKLITVSLGDYDNDNMGLGDGLSFGFLDINYWIYLAYIFFLPLLIINFFMGITVDEMRQLIQYSHDRKIILQCKYVLKLQDIFPNFFKIKDKVFNKAINSEKMSDYYNLDKKGFKKEDDFIKEILELVKNVEDKINAIGNQQEKQAQGISIQAKEIADQAKEIARISNKLDQLNLFSCPIHTVVRSDVNMEEIQSIDNISNNSDTQ